MANEQNQINCPNCGTEINVGALMHHQVSAQVAEKVQAELKKNEANLREQFKAESAQEHQHEKKLWEAEMKAKTERINELNTARIELERVKREKDELATTIKADAEKRFSAQLLTERAKISKAETEKHELKLRELAKQLEDQKKLTEEMKRKQEQGSMQTQGEVQELAIEEWLRQEFPLDTIEEVKKGASGADCVQIVNTRTRPNCGTIYYESKRTKHFQPSWIEKFKADIRTKNADVGVLVSEVLPADMERFGLKDGVWVCTFDEFKGLCAVLRESVVKLSGIVVAQDNKGDKAAMLYDFLTSNEFQMHIEAVFSGFTNLKSDLENEKRAMQRIWQKREKQLDIVVEGIAKMFGSMQGIAGNQIPTVGMLELPTDDSVL